jgi:transposase-like protein
MSQAAKAREQDRKARARWRVLRHHEQVTRNVSQTCRFFGISRTLFYVWRDRYSPRSSANGSTNTTIAGSTSHFEAGPLPSACASSGLRPNLFNN